MSRATSLQSRPAQKVANASRAREPLVWQNASSNRDGSVDHKFATVALFAVQRGVDPHEGPFHFAVHSKRSAFNV
jgi:hypothetical protein